LASRCLTPPPEATNIEVVKAQIERLPREDRAMLRPWLLARFDVRGYPATTYAKQEHDR
jgi:hypothetical protein